MTLEMLTFSLGVDAKVKVKIKDDNHFSDTRTLDVQVSQPIYEQYISVKQTDQRLKLAPANIKTFKLINKQKYFLPRRKILMS